MICLTHQNRRSQATSRLRAAAAAGLWAAALSGCGPGAERAEPELHTAAPIPDDRIELRLHGLAVNREPAAYAPPVADLPVEEVLPEGAWVEPGAPLLALSVDAARQRRAHRALDIRERSSRETLAGHQTKQSIEQLSERRGDLERERRLLDARVEATRQRDDVEIRIADLEAQKQRQRLADAERAFRRLEALGRTGVVSRRRLEQARDDLDRAREALRVPEDHLDFLRASTGAVTRHLLELDREAATLDLGAPGHEQGVFGSIEALRRRRNLDAAVAHRELDLVRRRDEKERLLEQDHTVRATVAGTVRYREDGVKVGDRLPAASALFLLDEATMGFHFDLPLRWRNLVTVADPDDAESGRLLVDVPQLRALRRPARIRSITAKPHHTFRGRVYRCDVELKEPVPGLREGMRVDCALPVRVQPGAVALPSWTVTDMSDPHVVMADGARRRIRGRLIGDQFVVIEGLRAGERVRAQPRSGPASATTLRFTGIVRPRERVDLEVPWRVEIIEMVAEGHRVKKDDIVAHLISLRGDPTVDRLEEARLQRERAAAETAIERIQADADVAEAYVAWRKAVLAVRRARLALLVERYGAFAGEVKGTVDLELARIDTRAADRQVADYDDPGARYTVSSQQVRAARLRAKQKARGELRAAIGAVAALRQRNWLTVWESREAVMAAEQEAMGARDAYSLQRARRDLRLGRALDAYQRATDAARRKVREEERLTVRAPIDGQVYYHVDDWGSRGRRPLRTGRRLRTTRPFYIPRDDARQLRLELPARFHARFTVGEGVQVVLPVLGHEPVDGKVAAISRHLHVGELAAEAFQMSGVVGTLPRVFTLMVDLDLDPEQARRVPPGVTGWLEVAP